MAGVTGRKRVAASGGGGERERDTTCNTVCARLCGRLGKTGKQWTKEVKRVNRKREKEERNAVREMLDKEGRGRHKKRERDKRQRGSSTLRFRMKTCPAQLGQSGVGAVVTPRVPT